jgi:precorrin-6B methylase 1
MIVTNADVELKEENCRELIANGEYEKAEEIASDLLDYGFRQSALCLLEEIASARELVDTDAELHSELEWDRHCDYRAVSGQI